MNPEQLQSLAALALAMAPVALLTKARSWGAERCDQVKMNRIFLSESKYFTFAADRGFLVLSG